MAKKTPKKYRQAKKAARPAAKAAFPGKTKAVRRDPMAKYSAEDKQIFKEITKESKGRYITDDKGNKIQVKPTETAKERIARERAEAMRKFREEVDADKQAARDERMAKKRQAAIDKQAKDKAARAGKPAPTLQQTAPNEKPLSRPVKKAAVKKVGTVGTTRKPDAKGVAKAVEEAKKIQATKKTAIKPTKTFGEISKSVTEKTKPATKGMTRAEKSAANKAAWKKMTNKPGAAKPAAAKAPVYSITDVQPEKASKGAKKAKFVQKKTKASVAKTTTTAPKTGGTVAIRPKGTVATKAKGKEVVSTRGTAKPVAGAAAKKTSKLAKFGRKFAVGAAATALGAEAVSLAKGSIYRDVKEIDRLETKLAKLQGKKSPNSTALGRLNQLRKGTAANLANFADLATFGAVGQTRRERMDQLNKLIAKEKKAKGSAKGSTKTGPIGNYAMTTGKVQSSAGATGGITGGTAGGAGGSTTKVVPGGTYVVKRGDTLSGIAKAAGVSLAEIRAANKKFAKNPKYKQGNMIWSGTTVKIPKKK
jgi:LysM repeat protein